MKHKIPEGLMPLAVPLASLSPDPANARLHPEDNISAIMSSLKRFGQDQPLVVQKNGLIVRKGNGRLEAAKRLGWTHIAALVVDEDNIDAAARAIADNRTAELAKWDERVLLASMAEIRKARPSLATTQLGFTTAQMEEIRIAVEASSRPVNAIGVAEAGVGLPVLPEGVGEAMQAERPEGRYKEQYGVIILCADAAAQEKTYNLLREQGYTVRVVTT